MKFDSSAVQLVLNIIKSQKCSEGGVPCFFVFRGWGVMTIFIDFKLRDDINL